jgi:hypothetical protein
VSTCEAYLNRVGIELVTRLADEIDCLSNSEESIHDRRTTFVRNAGDHEIRRIDTPVSLTFFSGTILFCNPLLLFLCLLDQFSCLPFRLHTLLQFDGQDSLDGKMKCLAFFRCDFAIREDVEERRP